MKIPSVSSTQVQPQSSFKILNEKALEKRTQGVAGAVFDSYCDAGCHDGDSYCVGDRSTDD
jgi:hypothetical protein